MASSLVAQAFKACLFRSARRNGSVSLPHRSFKVISGPIASDARGIRHASAAVAPVEETSKETLPTFDSLEGIVNTGVLQAVKDMKITTMSPVQSQVFPLLPELARPYNPQEPSTGPTRDLLVKAKTGTGKTLGFLLPAIEARLKAMEAHGVQAARDAGQEGDSEFERKAALAFARASVGTLVISPTRELATQIATEALRLTSKLDRENRNFGVRLFVGGEDKRRQIREFMQMRNDIVVATPGRLLDMLQSQPTVRQAISRTQVLILDEADTLLDMGFRPDIDAIEKELPPKPERQTFLFSATVSRAIQDIAKQMLAPNHKFINCVASGASPVHAHIPQYQTTLTNASEQIPHMVRLLAHDQLSNPNASKVVLFLPTTKMTQLFATLLRQLRDVLPAGSKTHIYELHSKKTMESRTKASNLFRHDKQGASILVTSDVSARGVDYPGVTRVIQVGIPGTTEQYIHRVGRTGRAGTQGRGDLILLPFEKGFLRSLSSVPLKPLSTAQLSSEVLELAKTHDADPDAFFADAPKVEATPTRSSRGYQTRVSRNERLFAKEVEPLAEEIDRSIDSFKAQMDGEAIEAVHETFMSLLGSNLSRMSALQTDPQTVVKCLQDWTTDGLGLSMAPSVSQSIIARICGDSGSSRKRSFGMDRSRRPGFGFSGRGHSQSRDQGYGSHSGSYRSRDGEGYGDRSYRVRDAESFGDRSYRTRDAGSFGGRSERYRDRESFGDRSERHRDFGDRSERHRDFGDRSPRNQERLQAPWMGRGSVKRRTGP